MINEVRRMQRRIAELESELMRVRAENDSLSAMLHTPEFMSVELHEPALT